MTTTEQNKLIAEFMGVEFINGVYGNCISAMPMKPFTSDSLKYNYSWDWLMPVAEKIESMQWKVDIEYRYTYIHNPVTDMYFETESERTTKLSACLDSVIQFIQWYNENKKP